MSRRTPRSFHARFTLTEGGRWQARVDELPEVRPADRSLSKLENRLRRDIAQVEGSEEGSLHLEITISTGDDALDADVSRVCALRAEAKRLAEQARAAAAPAARHLTERGVSLRDTGSVLGGYSASAVSALISNT